MRSDPNAVATLKREHKEANAIVFLHTNKDTIFEALENHDSLKSQRVLAGLRELLAE